MKPTKARPGDVLERRGEHGEVVVVEVVNVFTASDPGGAGNVRCADYRANGGAGDDLGWLASAAGTDGVVRLAVET